MGNYLKGFPRVHLFEKHQWGSFNIFQAIQGIKTRVSLITIALSYASRGLSRVVMEVKRVGSIQGSRISSMLLTHLLFVDHILLFLNGSKK
jgi:hypothetical protein